MATRSRDKWPSGVKEGPDEWRRSIYIFVKRSIRYPMMETFDAPDPTASCGRRIPTTVPVQALTLLNNAGIRTAAQSFADRILKQQSAEGNRDAQIIAAYRLALSRPPTTNELGAAKEFFRSSDAPDERSALTNLCHVLFTINEFVYID